MQGVYHRRAVNYPWVLLGKTTGVGHAEELMLKHNRRNPIVGEYVYLESLDLPNTLMRLATIRHRVFARRLAKSTDSSWKKIRKDAKMVWVKVDPRQVKMF